MSVTVIDFYKKGAHARGNQRVPDPITFGTKDVSVVLGYEPGSKSKPIKEPAHDIVEHAGHRHLLLNHGHYYDVVLGNGEAKTDVAIDSTKGHSALELPDDWEVLSVSSDGK